MNSDDGSNYAALALVGKNVGSTAVEQSGSSETAEQNGIFELTNDGIKLNGVLLERTADTTVLFGENYVVVGSEYIDNYTGVFPFGRKVLLSPFIMGKYEVTQELYKAVMTNQKVTVNGTEYTLNASPSMFFSSGK